MENEHQPISDGEKVVVLFLAILLDALSVIPGLGTVVAFLGLFSIGIWSWIRLGSIPFSKKLRKYITKRAFVFIIEALPIAQIFPGWTVMVLMGFRQGAKPSSGVVAGALALLFSLALLPAKSLALELTYPSFLPLREGLQLNELVQIIFTTSLVLGAALAFISLVYTGFEYIVSGANAGKRSAARKHIISTIVGIAILLGSVTFIRIINPDLVTIPPLVVGGLNIQAPKLVAAQDPATEDLGSDYSRIRLSENLDTFKKTLGEIKGKDGTIFASITALMKECSPDLCKPDPIPYEFREEYDCSYTQCSTDDEGNESCETISQTCSRCVAGICGEGLSCVGEPLPKREDIAKTLQEAETQFNNLTSLSSLVDSGRNIISSCGERTLSCVSLRVLGAAPSCDPAQDFFCGPTQSPNASLPLRDIAKQEDVFIKNIQDISKQVLSSTCSNTTFSCDGGCGAVTGQCAPSSAPSGCPEKLFTEAKRLNEIADTMTKQRDNLLQIISAADETLNLAVQSNGEMLLRSCREAREAVREMQESGTYKDGTCAISTTCCPTPAVIKALDACDPVDLFICS